MLLLPCANRSILLTILVSLSGSTASPFPQSPIKVASTSPLNALNEPDVPHYLRMMKGYGTNFSFDKNKQPYITCKILSKDRNETNARCPWPDTEFISKSVGCNAMATLTNPEKYMHNYTIGMFVPPEDFTVDFANCEHEKMPREYSSCRDDECVVLIDVEHMKKHRESGRRSQCCCRTHNCNMNVRLQFKKHVILHEGYDNEERTTSTTAPTTTTTVPPPTGALSSTVFIIALLVVFAVLVVVIGLVCWCCLCRGKLALWKHRKAVRDNGDEGMALMERGKRKEKKRNDLNASIDIIEMLAQGKMARIEKVRLTDRTTGEERFAVMKSTEYSTFRREEDVFGLLANGHENVAHLIGVNADPKENLYQLVLKIEELGDLATYLQTSVWSFTDTVKFMASFMDGLDYIHTPIPRPNGRSYTIAHRDIKSRNVLVRADRTAVITDFNCAQLLDTHRGFKQGKILQKGTYHYMAPEALKAFNCNVEGYTKIDIYAAALVFWELLNRTQMDAEDQIVPAQIPFAAEIEEERAVEEERFLNAPDYNPRETFQPKPVLYVLIRLVNDEGKRPIFREKLRTHLASKQLIESITFMWDHEGEVRLTAAGARNRFKELLEYIKEPMDSYDYPSKQFLKQPANLYYPPNH